MGKGEEEEVKEALAVLVANLVQAAAVVGLVVDLNLVVHLLPLLLLLQVHLRVHIQLQVVILHLKRLMEAVQLVEVKVVTPQAILTHNHQTLIMEQ